jgi:hypothetical protein
MQATPLTEAELYETIRRKEERSKATQQMMP